MCSGMASAVKNFAQGCNQLPQVGQQLADMKHIQTPWGRYSAMKHISRNFKTGEHVTVSVNTPCGYTLIEGAVVGRIHQNELHLLFSAGANRKMSLLPLGTQVALTADSADDVHAYNCIICSYNERPYIKIKVYERVPAMEKRRHRRISAHLPFYCSILDEKGELSVIKDAAKVGGRHTQSEICLSAGGFMIKTPFPVNNDTMAIFVFLPQDDSGRIAPTLSTSVYSYPSQSGKSYLSGFKFSHINESDRNTIDTLVNELVFANDAHLIGKKFPSCLTRIREHH